MKATIHTELRCGSCGQMMQYHQDVKIRCVQLKCEERNKEYHAPTVELYPTNINATEVREREEERNLTATEVKDNWDKYWSEGEGYEGVKRIEETTSAMIQPYIDRMEEIISKEALTTEKPKRGRPKTTQD